MSFAPPWILPRRISPARTFTTSACLLQPPRAGEPSYPRPVRTPYAASAPPSHSSGARKPPGARKPDQPRRHVRPPILGGDYWSGSNDVQGEGPRSREGSHMSGRRGSGGDGRDVKEGLEGSDNDGEEEGKRNRLKLTDEERARLTALEKEITDDFLVGRTVKEAERRMSVAFDDAPFLGDRNSPVTTSGGRPILAEHTTAELLSSSGAERKSSSDTGRKKPRIAGVTEMWSSPRPIDESIDTLMDAIVQHGRMLNGEKTSDSLEDERKDQRRETVEERGVTWLGLVQAGRKIRFIGVDLETTLTSIYMDKRSATVHHALFTIRAYPANRLPARQPPPFPDAYEAALRVRCERPCVHAGFVTSKAAVSKLAVERNKVRRLMKTALDRVAEKEGSWQFISPEIAYLIWPKPEVYETPVEKIISPLEKALKEIKDKIGWRVKFGEGAKSPPINFAKREVFPEKLWFPSPWDPDRWKGESESPTERKARRRRVW